MRLSKREYETLFLYSYGLKYEEIGHILNISTRTAINYMVRAKHKSKQEVKRATRQRTKHKESYKQVLRENIKLAKKDNRDIALNGYDRFMQFHNLSQVALATRHEHIKKSELSLFRNYQNYRVVLGKRNNQQ